jgi:hypothetical protein
MPRHFLERPGLVWTILATVVIVLMALVSHGVTIENDSFQYLSSAQNDLNGRFAETSLVHFDAERSFGSVPAPLVTFPFAYALAVALVGLSGLELGTAALLVSGIAVVASVPVLAYLLRSSGASSLIQHVILAAYVLNSTVIYFGTAAMTEASFTFLVLAGFALLIAARTARHHRWSRWVAAGLLFGTAYLVRYAGLFILIGLAALTVRYALARDRRSTVGHAMALLAGGAVAMLAIARNVSLVGDWRGGNEKEIANPLISTSLEVGRSVLAAFTGAGPGSLPLRVLIVILLVAAVATLLAGRRLDGDRFASVRGSRISVLVDTSILFGVYVVCMTYAGMTTVISMTPRMFAPMVPFGLLLVGGLLAIASAGTRRRTDASRLTRAGVILGACCMTLYLVSSAIAIANPPEDRREATARALEQVGPDGRSSRDAVLAIARPSDVIIANNGQATGFVLTRPTISLIDEHFSSTRWTEEAVRDLVDRYGASTLVITRPSEGFEEEFLPSDFIRGLAAGEAPTWLRLVHSTSWVHVYEASAP